MRNTLGIFMVCCLTIGVPVDGLRCYVCDNENSNSLCTSEQNVVECGENFDTCQTIVDYSAVSEKLSIIKTCTKNSSCDSQKDATHDMPCDPTAGDWICTSCCYNDKCNFNGSCSNQLVNLLYLLILILAIGLRIF
ncbi:hypothetical protein ScPMuIL_017089 [Solemya velum]